MIKPGTDNLIKWLDLNKIDTWDLSTTRDKTQNAMIFKSDPEQPREREQNRMIEQLGLSENAIIYVSGKCGKATTGQFSETWENKSGTTASVPAQPVNGIAGPNMDELEKRIQLAVEKTNFEWEKKMFEKQQKEFNQAKKEFDNDRNGIIGILVEKAAPILGTFMNKMIPAQPQVAGLNDTIKASPIAADGETTEQSDDINVFDDAEADKLFDLCARLKAVDPDYLAIIEKIVAFAESENPVSYMGMKFDYPKIKELFLNFEL